MKPDFYKSFEEKFRGSRQDIKSRLEIYLPFIKPLLNVYPESKSIDLGCGRGEWLELLMEQGFSAYGIDLNEEMLNSAKEKGLTVFCEEACNFLKNLPDQSHLVISSFHMVEHISFEEVQILVQEALRVLVPGGILILETPNPENIVVGTSNFYLDPTHKYPIPPALLGFLPEYYGFGKFKLLRLQENKQLINSEKILSLYDVFSGVSPDCAVVAQKSAEDSILSLNNQAFEMEYGLTLDHLASIYDDLHDKKMKISTELGFLTKLFCEFEFNQMAINKELNSIVDKLDSKYSELERQTEILADLFKKPIRNYRKCSQQIEEILTVLKEKKSMDSSNQRATLSSLLKESELKQNEHVTKIEASLHSNDNEEPLVSFASQLKELEDHNLSRMEQIKQLTQMVQESERARAECHNQKQHLMALLRSYFKSKLGQKMKRFLAFKKTTRKPL